MNVPGHDPKELWQKHNGPKGWHAWTSDHVGEVIEIRNGLPENIGKRPTCGGKVTVLCKVCQGTGTMVCPACRGNKVVRAGPFPCNAGDHSLATADTSGNSAASGQTKDDSIAGWQNVYRADYRIGSKSLLDKNERWENSRSANEKHHPGRPYG
jgi:hypothetical protein